MPFAAADRLVELEAEETVITVAAKDGGVLIKALVPPGQTVPVGGELAEVEINSTAPSPPSFHSTAEPNVNDETSTTDTGDVVQILMPQAGNTMEEGTVIEWRVREGEMIELGQIICAIETDKATIEYESPAAGRLARIVAIENEPIAVKEIIALVAERDAAAAVFLARQDRSSVATEMAAATVGVTGSHIAANHVVRAPADDAASGRIKASPAARKLAVKWSVDLASISAGSGPGGRILSSDLTRARISETTSGRSSADLDERHPMSRMRCAIATNLQRSKQTIPHFYLRMTINAAPMREFYEEKKPQTNCSLNDLVVLAVGRSMRDFPEVRSQIDGDDIVTFPHANIGIAVGIDDGLVVPVVMNVDLLSLAELVQESKRVIEGSRKGVLANMGKGNFTISNLGMFGVEEFSAIINPPESGILAVSTVRETVIVKNGSMSPGCVMTMTLSTDHRIVDGLQAAKFVSRLKEILENPTEELN